MTHALAYLRTSSACNVGGDSDRRQREAIHAYAQANGITIEAEFYDAAVSGTDQIADRPGFAAMLARIAGNGVRLVIIEDASRFARSMLVQELGIHLLRQLGVTLVTSRGDDLTDETDADRTMIRQIFGVIAQAEKTRLVAKLKGARDRASAAQGGKRVEGRKATDEALIARMKALRDDGLTLQQIADKLASDGVMTGKGKPIDHTRVSRLLKRAA